MTEDLPAVRPLRDAMTREQAIEKVIPFVSGTSSDRFLNEQMRHRARVVAAAIVDALGIS